MAPPATTLSPPAKRGRFRPLTLNTTKQGAIDPSLGASYRFVGVRPVDIVHGLGEILEPLGYLRTWPPIAASALTQGAQTRALPHHEGATVQGEIYYERGLGVDRAETKRRDRQRWIGLGVGLGVGVFCIILVLVFSYARPYRFLAIPAGLGFGLALISGMSFANADYWSDVVVATYRGTTHEKVAAERALVTTADYDVQVRVVRALSQDWETKSVSGRMIQASVRDPNAGSVSGAIRDAFLSPRLR